MDDLSFSFAQDSSDFSSFQLDRLMKQSQLSQRLESVRQEMSYSAVGVEDLVENTEDATVESSQLASDELSHYVLIKGNLNKENTTADNDDATTNEIEVAAEDGNADDEEQKPARKSSLCRMNDQFVIRKIERDRKAGCRFAPVCEVNLSSSGSSSDEDDDNDDRRQKSAEVKFRTSTAASQGHTDAGSVMSASEEKRKLPPMEDVIETKRRKSDDESSLDAMVEGESKQVKSPSVVKGDSDTEQKSLTSPTVFKTSDVQPITALWEDRSADIESQETASDKQSELDTEAESGRKEIDAETSEVCFKEPTNNGKWCITV